MAPSMLWLLPCVATVVTAAASAKKHPNFVIIFGDDWGYGDLGANWPATKALNLTPNLDKLAARGKRLTDFHVAASVCTPSRAGLLTGRLGLRTGVVRNFGPDSMFGLPRNETILPRMLKSNPDVNYRTGMIGKWHLGTTAGFHPSDRGFDSYLGVPYSIDMGCAAQPTITAWNVSSSQSILCPACPLDTPGPPPPPPRYPGDNSCGRANACADTNIGLPLFRNHSIEQQPVNLSGLSLSYMAEAERFIGASVESGDPFLLYFAASHVHVPQNTGPAFANKSPRGPFGDALLEMDNTVGHIINALDARGIFDDTLVLVTGDNGPWMCKCHLTGSAGPFTGDWLAAHGGGSTAKMTLWEGGHRVVGLAAGLGITPGVEDVLASSLDYMPTLASLSGTPLPTDRVFDGIDLSDVLLHGSTQGHGVLFHPLSGAGGSGPLRAMRMGKYKAHWTTGGAAECGGTKAPVRQHDPPLLFDLADDPQEAKALDTSAEPYAAIVKKMTQLLNDKLANISSTAHSKANYATGQAGHDANCCNTQHVACRCQH